MKYILLNKINGIYILMQDDKMIASSDSDFQSDYQIGKLSIDNCDEVFGIINKHKLAEETYNEYPNNPKDKPEWHYNRDVNCFKKRKAFVKGFDKAMELNKDKLFTVEDIKKAFEAGYETLESEKTYNEHYDILIQSLQQPTEIEVEIRCYIGNGNKESDSFKDPLVTNTGIPKLDKNDCIVLRKV